MRLRLRMSDECRFDARDMAARDNEQPVVICRIGTMKELQWSVQSVHTQYDSVTSGCGCKKHGTTFQTMKNRPDIQP